MRYKRKKILTGIMTCCLVAVGLCGTAFGAVKTETRIPIDSVSVQIRADVRADYDIDEATVYTTTDSSLYTIGAYTWVSKSKEYWEPGDVPKVQVEIHAQSGYYFNKTTGASKFRITGGTYASVKRTNNNETLLLSIKLTPASGTLDESDNADWVGYPIGKASWEPVPYAGAYELKLFRDGQLIQEVAKVNAQVYDFYPYMVQPGKYQFRVRAIPKDTEEQGYITPGDWAYSDELRVESDEVCSWNGGVGVGGGNSVMTPNQMGWVKDDDGWWYRNADGSYPSNSWQNINGSWYLFGHGGYIMTGWQAKNGAYYYLDSNGVMQTGWIQDNRKWFYLGADGALQTGWINVNGAVYFLDADGSMHLGWLLQEGKWYYLNPEDGIMVRNTYVGGRYLNAEGIWQ